MTRDEAIRVGIRTLAQWHRQDHGDKCVCAEAEQFGAQAAAVIDALAAGGVDFDVLRSGLGAYSDFRPDSRGLPVESHGDSQALDCTLGSATDARSRRASPRAPRGDRIPR
jgi:hypothetical protein